MDKLEELERIVIQYKNGPPCSDARYIAAANPDVVLRLVAIARAAKLAEGVLEEATEYVRDGVRSPSLADGCDASLAALRQALKEPE